MTPVTSLPDLIKSSIIVKEVSSAGWHRVYCEYCGDGKRTKGPRGGWLFAGDGVSYQCFNCGAKASYDPLRDKFLSKKMKEILDSFGIASRDYNYIALFNSKKNHPEQTTEQPKKDKSTFVKAIEIPNHFYLLADSDFDNDIIAQTAKNFLENKYCLSVDAYPFFLSTGISDSSGPKEVAFTKYLRNRLIIPYFRSKDMIFYEARDLTGKSEKKYISLDIPKSAILFNMDELYENTNSPLYVFEGALDAIHLNGVATMTNNVSPEQIKLLNSSQRKKVVVPDFVGDSFKLAELALQQGWALALPSFGQSVKDVSEAICKYGKLFTISEIKSTTYEGLKAKINLQIMSRINNKN